MPHPARKLSRLAARTRPPRQIAGIVAQGLSRRRVAGYASKFAGALPALISAPPGTTLWRAALIGPARYPEGYRDVVILSEGRLLASTVRQTASEGNVHGDPVAEIGRVLAAHRAKGRSHKDREARALIPSVLLDSAWLREAARRHDVPLNPTLATELLGALRKSCAATKIAFRRALDPEVASLLPEDADLERFHNWLSDDHVADEILRRRRAAYEALRAGCEHIRCCDAFALRLDDGEDPVALLGEILDAPPEGVLRLKEEQPAALGSFKEAQRKAWALAWMPLEVLAEISRDLERAGGWAGREMSFASIASEDREERWQAARWLISRSGIGRFIDYPATFADWDFEEGRKEFSEMLTAIVRYGLLPGVMTEADTGERAAPSQEKIAGSVHDLARLISHRIGAMSVEIARLQWRKVEPWLGKNLVVASMPSISHWPPLFAPLKDDKEATVSIECISMQAQMNAKDALPHLGPTVLYDVLIDGYHLLRLRDRDDRTVALPLVTQDELERAVKQGRVDARHVDREGWSRSAQWKRRMQVEVGRLIQKIAKGKIHCDLSMLRRLQKERAATAAEIATRPCGFDHRNKEARKLADVVVPTFMRHLNPNARDLANRLFGPGRDADLEADAAFLRGEAVPPVGPAPKPAAADAGMPRLLIYPPGRKQDEGDVPSEYKPFVASADIRTHSLRRGAAPKDPAKTRFVVIDLETTGLGDRARLVELAAIELIGPEPTGKALHALVDPGMPISDGAFAVNGISDDMLRGQPSFAKIADQVFRFIGSDTTWLVAHKAEFDADVLDREFDRAGHSFKVQRRRTVCTMALGKFYTEVGALDDVCDKLHIDRSSRIKHRALIDAELCAKVFARLVFGRRPAAAKPEGNEVVTGPMGDVPHPGEATKT